MSIEKRHTTGHFPAAGGAFRILRKHSAAFLRGEDGAVIALTLFLLLLMLAAGGLAIDTMRHEMSRAKLQNTLDSAVLAGAGAPFGSDAKAIVEDYFLKANMAQYLHEIDDDGEGEDDIITTLNSTKVSANASMQLSTYLMKLSGVKTLGAAAASTAEMRVPKLEVALVLDVSGSMGSNNKLGNLKTAAKDFVSTILGASEIGDTVVSVVPFSWSVTPTETMFNALAVDQTHTYSTCLRFKTNDFGHATLTSGASATSNGVPVDQMVYTSLYGDWQDLTSGWRSCFTDDYMEILPYSISESDLHSKIDALRADGNTSGHQGMNWGAAMLDPTFRTVSNNLRSANEMDGSLDDVPADYDEPETLKVIVMMGDGQNTTSYFFDKSSPQYRGPNSDLYRVTHQEQEFDYAFDIYNPSREWHEDWVEQYCHLSWLECVYRVDGPVVSSYYLRDPSPERYYDLEDDDWISASEFDDLEDQSGFIDKERLDWEEAWGMMSPRFYGETTGNWGPWNDYVSSERLNGGEKNSRMLDTCAATKTEGVVVFTIGFEISRGGTAETVLETCASSHAHYYRADGINITDAFSSIAANVVNLRLTQ
ncbi:pilus assembly protein TadG-related protein [Roseovarius sp. TE539]|uniref:pilus assembly protein TadG-related protein n=1 Tax=Roseovarius sp. TE539 TaxID=2249812 RepID=UPI00215B8A55|nr:pilus assembly protein TadG-related protein [Roseovarius sp. TE539]